MASTTSSKQRSSPASKPRKAPQNGRTDGGARGGASPPAKRGASPSPDGSPGLDALLTDAAVGRKGQRWLPGAAGAKAAAKLARRPRRVARRVAGLTGEVAKIAAGRSELAPAKGDRRFADPAWTGNPLFRRLGQAYLAAGGTAHELLNDAELE